MALSRFKASNHPQQSRRWGADDTVDDRATHPLLFAELAERFGPFDVDVAAAAHNTKCTDYFTRDDDGLAQPWRGIVWCNPPYSDIAPWVRKAWTSWVGDDPRIPAQHGMQLARDSAPYRIVMIVPANRTEQQWWQLMVEPFRDREGSPLSTEFLAGRLRFLKPGQTAVGPNQRPPFGCVLLIWSGANGGASTPHVWTPDTITGGLFGDGSPS